MTELLHINRKTVSIACGFVLLLSTVALSLNIKSHSQRLRGSDDKEKIKLIKQVEESPEQPLRILGNDDCPLRITEAKVKEIPSHLFTKLTGRVTDLATVASFPEATLVNTSGQTVTRFFLAIREPESRTTRGMVRSNIAIKSGETYVIKREDFAEPEKVTVAGENRHIRHALIIPGIDSEKRWIQFAARPDFFITIVKVDFEDGSSWMIKEGGEVR